MRKWIDNLSLPAGFAGLVLLAAAIGYYFLQNEFGPVVRVLVALSLLLIAYFFYGNSRALRGRVGLRQLRYGSNALVMVVVMLGILVLANVLAARNDQRWDLTATGEFSLSPESLKALASVKESIKIIGFYSSGDASQQKAQDLLDEYKVKSDKISYEFIDPDIKPAEAQRYGIRDYGTLVFLRGARRQDITAIEESEVTSAILRVNADKETRLAFLSGHGERSVDIADRTGYRQVKQLLEQNNYKVETLNLTTNPTLTTDIAVLVVAAPRSPLLESEKDIIRRYLENGGRMVVMGDPNLGGGVNDLIAKWGVEVGKGAAIDERSSLMGDGVTVVVQKYLWSPITKDLGGMTVLPLATNVSKTIPAPQGIWYDTLLETTDASWVEMDAQVAQYDEGVDIKGPVTLGISVEEQGDMRAGTKDQPRLVVFGDSDFVSNGFLDFGANADIFLKSVNWLTSSELAIAVKPKQKQDKSMALSSGQGNFVLVTSAMLLPGLVLVAGAAVWWRRR